jgi:hypothetical protein
VLKILLRPHFIVKHLSRAILAEVFKIRVLAILKEAAVEHAKVVDGFTTCP